MITEREKQTNSIPRQAVTIFAAYNNISISTVFNFFEHHKIPYSWNSVRTAYYRARWKQHKKPTLKKAIEKKLLAELLMIKKMYPDKKVSDPKKRIIIQGDYYSSINAVFEK